MERLTIQQLRQALRERGCFSAGSKKQLVKRLADLVDTEGSIHSQRESKQRQVRLDVVEQTSGKCCTLVLPLIGDGRSVFSTLLSKVNNKFRSKASRVFVALTAEEITTDNVLSVLRPTMKLVVSRSDYSVMSSPLRGAQASSAAHSSAIHVDELSLASDDPAAEQSSRPQEGTVTAETRTEEDKGEVDVSAFFACLEAVITPLVSTVLSKELASSAFTLACAPVKPASLETTDAGQCSTDKTAHVSLPTLLIEGATTASEQSEDMAVPDKSRAAEQLDASRLATTEEKRESLVDDNGHQSVNDIPATSSFSASLLTTETKRAQPASDTQLRTGPSADAITPPRSPSQSTASAFMTPVGSGRHKPRWREDTELVTPDSERREHFAFDASASSSSFSSSSSAGSATTTSFDSPAPLSFSPLLRSTSNPQGGPIESWTLEDRNASLVRGHDVLTRKNKKLEAQLKASEKAEKKLRDDVTRLSSQVAKLRGAQEKYRDVQVMVSQQEAASAKLTRERDRLLVKNTALAAQVKELTETTRTLRGVEEQNATLQERVQFLSADSASLAHCSTSELDTLLKHFSEGLGRVRTAISTSLEKERKALAERRLCKICYDKEIDTLLLPCCHYVACERCATKLSKCAVCCRGITERKLVYTS